MRCNFMIHATVIQKYIHSQLTQLIQLWPNPFLAFIVSVDTPFEQSGALVVAI